MEESGLLGWDWEWRWAGASRKSGEKKRWIKEAGNSPPLICLERKDLGREAAMGKTGWIGKNSYPTKFRGSNCAYSIGTEPKRRSAFPRMKSRELQMNHDQEIGIKEVSDTEENLWSRNEVEPRMFCGFWAVPRGKGAA